MVSKPPRRPLAILASGYSCTCEVTTQNVSGLVCVTNRMQQKCWCVTSKSQGIEDTATSALFTFRSCALEETSHSVEYTQAALWRGFTGQGTETPYQQPSWTCQSGEGTLLGAEPHYSASQHLNCNLMRHQPYHHSAKLVLNPDPQKLREIINVYYYFKPLALGAICHTATDNQYNRQPQVSKGHLICSSTLV